MDTAKRTVLVLSAVVFFVMLGIAMITPDIAQYAKALGADPFLAGVLIGALPAARVVLDLPAGALGDRFGNRRMMMYGLGIIVVSSMIAALAFSYFVLLGARFLEGVGSAFYVTSSLAALAKAAPPDRRGRYMGVYVNMLLLGQIFGPVIGGAVTIYGGLSAPFWAYAGFAGVGLVLVTTTLALPDREGPAKFDWGAARRVLADRSFVLVNLGVLAAFFARGGVITTVLPFFAQMNWGLGPAEAVATTGVMITVMAGASLLTMYPSGLLADRYGRKWTFVSSLLLMALALPFIYAARDLASAIPTMAVVGLIFGLTGPMASWATDLAPPESMGMAMGVYRTIGDVGFLLGPVVMGAVLQATLLDGRVSQVPFLVASGWLAVTAVLLVTARDPAGERARARGASGPPGIG